jgi:6-phosphogluconolactonase (cycloisomerase 2 family)
MSKRWAWLLGIAVLISIGLLVACSSSYSPSSDGLVLVSSQANQVIDSFSFNLNSGSISQIGGSPSTSGTPSAMVLDPTGAYAYVIINGNSIASFKVNSDGSLKATGNTIADPNPTGLAMDAAGKFLFVAEGLANVAIMNATSTPCTQTPAQYGVCVYGIGSGGALTVANGAYVSPGTAQTANIVAIAATPTVFPPLGITGQQNAVCSNEGNNPPTTEFLYAVDSVNYQVWAFSVDTSTGALGNPPTFTQVPVLGTGAVPSGVVVEPCDRFAYVTNYQDNTVSAYTICNGLSTQSPACPSSPDGTLRVIPGTAAAQAFSIGAGLGPGPLVADPFGNFLYVLDQKSDQVSPLRIGSVSGVISSQSPVSTGANPTGIAIRADGSWLFVANNGAASNASGTISQFSVIPASGTMSGLPAVPTDNRPFGVAVK